jgi:lipoprotein-releasing system ATP-binding protein
MRWVFVPLKSAQSLLDLPGGISPSRSACATTSAPTTRAREISARTGLSADSWTVLNKSLLIGLRSQNASSYMIQIFIIIAVALGIASVLVVSVVQKSKEIGILKAVGTSTSQIKRIFLIQGAIVGLFGSFARLGAGHGAGAALREHGQEPGRLAHPSRSTSTPRSSPPPASWPRPPASSRRRHRQRARPSSTRSRRSMPDPVLELKGVTKDYGEKVKTRALRGVDLTLASGEFAALVGPSGSGKSTLLNLIGLLDEPTQGQIWLAGTETTRLDDAGRTRFRGQTLGFVFQFHHLIPALTAIENVMVPMWARAGRPDDAMREHAQELLDAVGIGHKAASRSGDLSGGQQQRVAIARALSMDPPLVLADEPTGNLDTASADEVFVLLRRFNRERGTSFLIVTHDTRLAQRTDRIVELVDGQIVKDEPWPPRA